jgi:hypothetical protein
MALQLQKDNFFSIMCCLSFKSVIPFSLVKNLPPPPPLHRLILIWHPSVLKFMILSLNFVVLLHDN